MTDSESRDLAVAEETRVIPASRWISPLTNLMVGIGMMFLAEEHLAPDVVRWVVVALLIASFPAWLAKKEWSFFLVDTAVALIVLTSLLTWALQGVGNDWLIPPFLLLVIFFFNRALHGEILRKRSQMEAEQPGSSRGWWPTGH